MNDLFEYLREEMEACGPQEGEEFVAFGDWSDSEIKSILGLGRKVLLPGGQQVIRMASDADKDIFTVISGELEAYHSIGGKDRRLTLLKPGDLFGEMSFVNGRPRSANVRALREALLLRIGHDDLDALCAKDPKIALKFMKEIAKILSFRIRKAESATF
jgi:CRP/FNR family transcriptional regulator, cyclic AMP receptor protein